MGVIVNGYEVSFGGDGSDLELVAMLHNSVNIIKTTELNPLKR